MRRRRNGGPMNHLRDSQGLRVGSPNLDRDRGPERHTDPFPYSQHSHKTPHHLGEYIHTHSHRSMQRNILRHMPLNTTPYPTIHSNNKSTAIQETLTHTHLSPHAQNILTHSHTHTDEHRDPDTYSLPQSPLTHTVDSHAESFTHSQSVTQCLT